jgi:hypothetical protein
VGLIPEPDLEKIKRPGDLWEKTAAPLFFPFNTEKGRSITIKCFTPGASIAFRIESDQSSTGWQIYTRPVLIQKDDKLYAKACRLGYLDSEEACLGRESPSRKGSAAVHWRERIPPDLMVSLLELKAWDGKETQGIPAFKKALHHEAGAMRYWAVLGLVQAYQDRQGFEEILPLLLNHLKDPCPSVAITAAEALCCFGREDEALPVLKEQLESPRESVRLFAAAGLNRIGEKARPVLPNLKKAYLGESSYVTRIMKHILKRFDESLPDSDT